MKDLKTWGVVIGMHGTEEEALKAMERGEVAIYIYIYVCICVYMCVCVYVCVHVCVYVGI